MAVRQLVVAGDEVGLRAISRTVIATADGAVGAIWEKKIGGELILDSVSGAEIQPGTVLLRTQQKGTL